jgi:hypothetical protein
MAARGHKLEVKPSEKRLPSSANKIMSRISSAGSKASNKLLLKNIAFQATQRLAHIIMYNHLLRSDVCHNLFIRLKVSSRRCSPRTPR